MVTKLFEKWSQKIFLRGDHVNSVPDLAASPPGRGSTSCPAITQSSYEVYLRYLRCVFFQQQMIRRAKACGECVYCYKQGDIQQLSSLDQQPYLCKGKFDTEYVLSTLKRAGESLNKHSLAARKFGTFHYGQK